MIAVGLWSTILAPGRLPIDRILGAPVGGVYSGRTRAARGCAMAPSERVPPRIVGIVVLAVSADP